MCGIVGILGREPVATLLVDALKRLEYRGYDSAGVATLEGGQLARRRAEGKLRQLEARLAREPLAGTIGIGHTRWATHGRPTESNAHPHATDRLAVVHNGIIENFRELREELEKKGAPLAIGYGEGEMYLGSDAIALAPFTDTISYLEDGDSAVLTRSGVDVFDAGGSKVERAVLKSSAAAFLLDKGN